MKQHLNDNVLLLDGWQKPVLASTENTAWPSHQESDCKIICPVASGHLPIRSDWLDLYKGKYKSESVQAEFQEIVEQHNKLFNVELPEGSIAGKTQEACRTSWSSVQCQLPGAAIALHQVGPSLHLGCDG